MLCVLGMLQHQSALQVLGTVQSAGQPEMALKVGAGLVESAQNRIRLRVHIATIASASANGSGSCTAGDCGMPPEGRRPAPLWYHEKIEGTGCVLFSLTAI